MAKKSRTAEYNELRRQREHRKEARAKKRRERAWNNISEDIVKARSQKITYGQYMAKRRLSHDA